ncbi:hypothetical protein NDU88_007826 [Pleurodeles waltl]|uniref:Uncharacterized protein n=1 Tax=Pleurodeles waltl TaxID=8319 RepID=A0AAV7PQ53_PLEWA|nr:hypothetical protein NDU88_007826 [Pleurodeles waltl]
MGTLVTSVLLVVSRNEDSEKQMRTAEQGLEPGRTALVLAPILKPGKRLSMAGDKGKWNSGYRRKLGKDWTVWTFVCDCRRVSSQLGDAQQALAMSETETLTTGLTPSADNVLQDTNAKFSEPLAVVQGLRATLELKLDTLIVDMGHMHEEYNKLKKRVSTHEATIKELQSVVSATQEVGVRLTTIEQQTCSGLTPEN